MQRISGYVSGHVLSPAKLKPACLEVLACSCLVELCTAATSAAPCWPHIRTAFLAKPAVATVDAVPAELGCCAVKADVHAAASECMEIVPGWGRGSGGADCGRRFDCQCELALYD